MHLDGWAEPVELVLEWPDARRLAEALFVDEGKLTFFDYTTPVPAFSILPELVTVAEFDAFCRATGYVPGEIKRDEPDFPAFPDRNDFTVYAKMEAAREVGGDFYDFFFVAEDLLFLAIGDVSGKGVPAALFMAISKALIRSRAADNLSTAAILSHVNDQVCQNNDSFGA